MMIVENPIAFSFIMQDDIYLLNAEKALYTGIVPDQTVAETELTKPVVATPAITPSVKTELPAASTEAATPPPPIVEVPPVNFKYLGNYKKSLLIIVHYTEVEFIAEKHLIALENILTRLGFSLDDAAILNRGNFADAGYNRLTEFFKPQKMLLLGKNALPDGIEALTLNKIKALNNCNTLFSFSFDDMMDNTEYKKAFWEQMKQL